MVAEHDPEVVRERVRTALAAMADAIESFDGTREKFIGDAVFAVFGWPRAHDDDAVRATLAALAIRDALAGMVSDGQPLEVRIGIATGEVVTTARDGSAHRRPRADRAPRSRPRRASSRSPGAARSSSTRPPWTRRADGCA